MARGAVKHCGSHCRPEGEVRKGRRFLIWFWSSGGGGSQFAARLAQRLGCQFGAENVALSLRADDPTAEWARLRGVNVLSADIVSDRKRPLRTLIDLRKGAMVLQDHIRESGADSVILAMNFAAAAPLSTTLDLPLIYCAHDPLPHTGDYAARMQRLTQGFLLRRAQYIVALSSYAAGQLRNLGVENQKIAIAPLSSVFQPRQPRCRSVQQKVRFLFVGRMIAYKGLETLSKALASLAHRDDWQLRVAGMGPALNDEIISRLVAPQVEIVGRSWMSYEQVDQLLAESDVLLAPYQEATQSGVIADALTWGVPVVATPVGALSEQLGCGLAGWLAQDSSPSAFADAMLDVLRERQSIAAKSQMSNRLAHEAWDKDWWGWLDALGCGQSSLALGGAKALSVTTAHRRAV